MPNWIGMNQNMGGFGQALAGQAQQKMAQQQALRNLLQQELIKAKIQQQNRSPMDELLERAKVAEAAKTLGNRQLFDMVAGGGQQFQNMPQGISNMPQAPAGYNAPMIPAPQGVQSGGLRPQFGQSALKVPSYERNDFGEIVPKEIVDPGTIGDIEAIKKSKAKAQDLAGKQTEAILESQQNLSRLFASGQGLMATGKQAIKEMGGYGAAQYYPALAKRLWAKSGLADVPPDEQMSGLSTYKGQLVETTLALSPILTGQNRIIEGLVRMIEPTLSKFPTTETEFLGLTKQTLKNGYRLSLGLTRNAVSADILEQINNADEATVDNFLNKMMSTGGLTPEDEKLFEQTWEKIKATPANVPETFDVNPLGKQFNNKKPIKLNNKRPIEFNSEQEAKDANLKPGTRITIKGRPAIWE